MEKIHIPNEIINTIKLIYSNAFTSIDPKLPDIPINRGVLQGASTSPILFSLYINDLLILLEKAKAFADDIMIYS